MLWMTLSGAAFASNYAVIRHLAQDIHIFELVFFRNVFGLLALTPFLWRLRHDLKRPKRPSLIVWRGALQTMSSSGWFYGMTVVPLASATALMLIEPIIGSILAIIIFKEKSKPNRWLAVALGLIGAMIIVRPGFAPFSWGVISIMAAATLWSCFLLIGKAQSQDEPVVVVVAYPSALTAPLSLIPAVFFWTTPSLEQLLWMVVLGSVATFAYYCITTAYKIGEVTVVSPLTFLRMVFAAIVGFILFQEIPEIWVWLGGILVVLAGTYLARSELKSTK